MAKYSGFTLDQPSLKCSNLTMIPDDEHDIPENSSNSPSEKPSKEKYDKKDKDKSLGEKLLDAAKKDFENSFRISRTVFGGFAKI